MFLNMLDTLVGAGAYATLSPRRAHLLPKIDPLYTHHVLSATQFDALKRAKPFRSGIISDLGARGCEVGFTSDSVAKLFLHH
jgi:hypothetical protein